MDIREHPYAPKADPKRIVLADGTVIENGSGARNRSSDDLWLRFPDDMKLGEATALLEDPAKTEVIEIVYSQISREVFDGYTELTDLRHDFSLHEISARLKKKQ